MSRALLIVLALLISPSASEEYISYKDKQTAKDADAAVTKYCTTQDADNAVDAAEAKENLQDALGGKNFLLDSMKESKDPDEFSDKLGEEVSGAAGSAVMPFFLAAIAWLMFWCFCCTACPCCKKCRCGKGYHKHGIPHKVIGALPVALAFFMTIVGSATSDGGAATMVAGFENMACESAELLNGTLQGTTGTLSFIGLLPALQVMKGVEDSLNDGSAFMVGLDNTLADTKIVSDAIAIASSTLDSMSNVMDLTATSVQTVGSPATSTYRKCVFCETLKGILATASTELQGGIGQALANARNEVAGQLNMEKRQELQKTVRDSASPMMQMKDSFVTNIGWMVDPSVDLTGPLKSSIPPAVSIVFMGAFFATFAGACSVGSCVAKEKTPEGKHSKIPHRCACCSWAISLPLAMLCFIIGGILYAFSLPLSAICLIMDDIDGDMIKDIAPAINLNITGPGGDNMIKMFDNCINPENKSLNANFLDLIVIVNETDGTEKTMREELQNTVSQPINDKFDQLGGGGGSVSLADSDGIKTLIGTIRNNSIQSMILATPTEMQADSKFSALATATQVLQDGLGGSMGCSPHVYEGNTIPGMTTFIDEVMTKGSDATVVPTTVCSRTWKERSCGADAVCTAGDEYMKLYLDMTDASLTTYRCDVWERDDGTECDTYDFADVAACLRADGTMKVKTKTCNFADFKVWYSKADERIQKAFEYVDSAVAAKQSGIATGLKNLVYDNMLNPLFSIFDGVSCGWLPGFWQATVDSLCFQGVYGMRRIGQGYILTAFFIVILAINMYVVWRRSIDNVNEDSGAVEELPESQNEVW